MTLVEGDSKPLFSIATPFIGLLHFTLDPYFIMLGVKQIGINYYFWVFCMTRPGIESRSPAPSANTLLIRPNVEIVICNNINDYKLIALDRIAWDHTVNKKPSRIIHTNI